MYIQAEQSVMSFDTATYLQVRKESLATFQRVATASIVSSANASLGDPNVVILAEAKQLTADIAPLRETVGTAWGSVSLPTSLRDEDNGIRMQNGAFLLPHKRRRDVLTLSPQSWISSTLSGDGSVHEQEQSQRRMKPRRIFSALVPDWEPTSVSVKDQNETIVSEDSSLQRNEVSNTPGDVGANLMSHSDATGDTDVHSVVGHSHQGDYSEYYYSEVLAEKSDPDFLSPYQCELRKHIELFEAEPEEVRESVTPGRKGKVVVGQVGLRCRYCAGVHRSSRSKGAVNYSHTIEGLYQIAQNIAKLHLCERCIHIPSDVKKRMLQLRAYCSRSPPRNCKNHWIRSIRQRGVYEFQSEGHPKRLMYNAPQHATQNVPS